MDELAELKVGDGWRYQCKSCDYQVKVDSAFPEKCPGCGAGGWWGHLTSQGPKSPKSTTAKPEPLSGERYQDTTPDFCPPKSDVVVAKRLTDKNAVTPPDNGGKRGRPLVMLPDDLIQQLSNDGLGAIRIAEKLKEQGIEISYKTVLRRLQASLL